MTGGRIEFYPALEYVDDIAALPDSGNAPVDKWDRDKVFKWKRRQNLTQIATAPRLLELQEKAKDDPELVKQLEAAKRVMERYSEILRKLADS